MEHREAPIGIFDSGIGGLTVVREIRRLLPHENIIYVGDTARVPYGCREKSQVLSFMHQILRFFAEKNIKMAVVACNTMTAYGFQEAVRTYPFSIIPMNSAMRDAISVSPRKKIGVIATAGTVAQQMHAKAAAKLDAAVQVYVKACPEFVPLIESGKIRGEEMEAAVRKYMGYFEENTVDSLILGCTHYPLVKELVQKQVGDGVILINPACSTAADTMRVLDKKCLLSKRTVPGRLQMYFSAALEQAEKMTKLILQTDQAVFEEIDLTAFDSRLNLMDL